MITQTLGVCATCDKPATMRCAGCKDAPDYLPGDALDTFYCDRDCQIKTRETHKDRCRNLSRRIALHRAAKILKTALLAYREMVYDLNLTHIESKDGILRLHQIPKTRPMRCVFPGHLTNNIEHKEAALLVNQCTTAMVLLGRLTRKLLSGVPLTFEIVDLEVGKPRFPAKLYPAPESSGVPHTVIIIGRLFVGETWIIDTTGCQYGFKDVLVPFKRYLEDHQCRMLGERTTYDATETKDLDYYAELPFMNTGLQKEDRKIERRARLHFAKFVDAQITPDILQGPSKVFEEKRLSLESDLKLYMQSYNK
ncbi:uncharacterized protein TrAtP1_007597 [Trichoderma atroviride]|uniref:MYND-type domain-containing protein n=1 Tax=Hypocrea atroviridis (strain ATCC 20476 / IMI 206040) TaxID=452589 RepID=G9NGS7_HYPAI|nr:uncharacterized protein TRIATDRAFT_211995 [Trichoderma atroviride IMI 206040]EHK50487.1 hypothetical protein TRIATDRAFT_211995 [Trichoderma atroviride IMI 206040]UKZ66423.1 hypothetical protein TrAtP1_007597 [Trichoderma atroviride]